MYEHIIEGQSHMRPAHTTPIQNAQGRLDCGPRVAMSLDGFRDYWVPASPREYVLQVPSHTGYRPNPGSGKRTKSQPQQPPQHPVRSRVTRRW